MEITYIYALCDPRTSIIRYVGMTCNLKQRYNNHINSKLKTHRSSWIKSLGGLLPEMIILDKVDSTEWDFWEMYWIAQYKCWGFNLTNHTIGGKGVQGLKVSEYTRKIKSEIGKTKRHTEASKKKMSESRKGIVFSEIHLKNLSLSHIGQNKGIPKSGDLSYLKRKILQYDGDTLIKEWDSIKEAALFYNVNQSSISHCCAGRKKKIKGFRWVYK